MKIEERERERERESSSRTPARKRKKRGWWRREGERESLCGKCEVRGAKREAKTLNFTSLRIQRLNGSASRIAPLSLRQGLVQLEGAGDMSFYIILKF